jgi:hypothetical protein
LFVLLLKDFFDNPLPTRAMGELRGAKNSGAEHFVLVMSASQADCGNTLS